MRIILKWPGKEKFKPAIYRYGEEGCYLKNMSTKYVSLSVYLKFCIAEGTNMSTKYSIFECLS